MRVLIAGFIFLLAFSSCFLFRDYRKAQFTFSQNGQKAVIPLVVPKGFSKEERWDTAGVSLQTFYYPNGALLYAAYVTDTATQLQPIDERLHEPAYHRLGGWVYKGQNSEELFYREIRQGHLRFGYRYVPRETELLFDSATNYASLQKPLR